jgi:hypothetical protein
MRGHDPALNAYLDSLRLRGLASTTHWATLATCS